MADPAPQPNPLAQEADTTATGRSRVYIACTLCRQRKIKCGGEQPACRNCVRIEVSCHYDAEPKRRGPDKRPGTRTRTRKGPNGAPIPLTSRITGAPNDPPLVPSQIGPERSKKRSKIPRVPSLDHVPSQSYEGPYGTRPSNLEDRASASSIPKIAPPSLPGELEHVAGIVPGRARTGANFTQVPSGQGFFNIVDPHLPNTLASHSLPDASKSLDTNTRLGNWDQSIARGSAGDGYRHDTYAYPGGASLPEDQLIPSNATVPISHSAADFSLLQGSQPDPRYVSTDVSSAIPISDAGTGSAGLSTQSLNAENAGIPISLSIPSTTTQPGSSSPIFSRLQHTHDPHLRPPANPFAGLAYPRSGVAVPALERGRGPSGFTAGGLELLGTASDTTGDNNLIDAQSRFQVADDYSYPHGSLTSPASDDMTNKPLPYTTTGPYNPANTYTHGSAADLPYQGSGESTYGDYPTSTQPGGNYIHGDTARLGHYPASEDTGYLSQTDSAYAPSSADSTYASQTDGYSSDVPTPAEITVLPPPANQGLLEFWNDGADGSVGQYDDSVSGYLSGTYGSVSNPETGSTYNESTATEEEDRRQTGGDLVGYRQSQNEFVQNLYYDASGSGYGASWVSEPSVAFARKTWWDSLLETYAPTKSEAALRITSDLKYLFKTSNYWLSFLNINLFMTNYNHKERRNNIQPSLILAALAYSTFTQSSEIERGQSGRSKAMELRTQAQAALEASLNSQRLDPTLAQAAWLLALFEVSAHPEHSTGRSRSALIFLDGVIRMLGLTVMDVMDPQASVFSADRVPRIPLSQRKDKPDPGAVSEFVGTSQAAPATCACQALSIVSTTTHGQLTPFWVSSAGWDPNWNESEIRREESRRLVWSALTLAAGFTAHDAAFAKDPTELHIIDAANYALCFPGETMIRRSPTPVHSPHESVWALYGRAMLLWNSCLTLRKKSARMTDAQRAEFAVNVWLETNTIEEALNRHTCEFERNSLFQGREYLFNTRMFISWEFRRYIPSPDTEVHQQFHRRKAEEWLRHQAEVAKRLMHGLHHVTGMASNVLGKRPYFVWWFMSQVSRCLSLWQCDQSLFIALDVARAFLPPIDYLTCLWPCHAQRIRYNEIRQRLHNECIKYGLEPPPPPQLVIPTAIF